MSKEQRYNGCVGCPLPDTFSAWSPGEATNRAKALMSTQTSVPAGWYPDTNAPRTLRWWDGQRWTNHTQPDPKAAPVPAAQAHTATVTDTAPTKRKPGLFGGDNKRKLEDEVEELRSALSAAGALSAIAMSRETERVRAQLDQATAELVATQVKAREDTCRVRAELAAIRAQVVETNEIAQLQEAGVYAFAHHFRMQSATRNSWRV